VVDHEETLGPAMSERPNDTPDTEAVDATESDAPMTEPEAEAAPVAAEPEPVAAEP